MSCVKELETSLPGLIAINGPGDISRTLYRRGDIRVDTEAFGEKGRSLVHIHVGGNKYFVPEGGVTYGFTREIGIRDKRVMADLVANSDKFMRKSVGFAQTQQRVNMDNLPKSSIGSFSWN